MKNLLIVLFASGIFPAISLRTAAQNNLHSITVPAQSKPLKFIEGIEIKPAVLNYSIPGNSAAGSAITTTNAPTPAAVMSASIEKSTTIQFKYAQLLNKEVESINNLALFNFVENWWGTRYRYGGTTKSGIDCSAFTGMLQSKVYGFNLPRTAREQYNASERVGRYDMKEGDLIFFNTRGGISHVGVYLTDGYFVHSSTRQGVTISSLEDEYYQNRFIGAGRINPQPAIDPCTEIACD